MTTEEPHTETTTEKEQWYSRPVFSVSKMNLSLNHYCEALGFKQEWKYEEEGQTIVTQVSRGDFEIILASNLDRIGEGRVFVALSMAEYAELEARIKENNIDTKRIHWGYPIIQISDTDGNELLFPSPE